MTIISKESVWMMSNSGHKIDYSIRPAKCVERKIICELLLKFKNTIPIYQYRYIGFGSFYFVDFILFHNQLNIDKMISIEKSHVFERYNLNKPYNCIDIMFCDAQDALSRQIDFSSDLPDFIWLDYDGSISMDIISDLITASQKVHKGSFLFASFNPSIRFNDTDEERLPKLKEMFNDYLPSIKEKEIDAVNMPRILYKTVNNAVQKAVSDRLSSENISASSIFNVKYRDGAPMCTLGYYFHETGEKIDLSAIESLPGVTCEDVPIEIKVPRLTKAEIRILNKMLPNSSAKDLKVAVPYLDDNDIENYIKLYKFYPNYIDSPYYV